MPKRILCVDDDEEVCNLAALLLPNYEVVSAHSVAAAQTKLREEQFDLILLDHNLPDVTGLDFCRTIRTTNKDIPIILCTASGLLNQENVAEAGAQSLLIKGLEFVNNLEFTIMKLLHDPSVEDSLHKIGLLS